MKIECFTNALCIRFTNAMSLGYFGNALCSNSLLLTVTTFWICVVWMLPFVWRKACFTFATTYSDSEFLSNPFRPALASAITLSWWWSVTCLNALDFFWKRFALFCLKKQSRILTCRFILWLSSIFTTLMISLSFLILWECHMLCF